MNLLQNAGLFGENILLLKDHNRMKNTDIVPIQSTLMSSSSYLQHATLSLWIITPQIIIPPPLVPHDMKPYSFT